MATDSPFVKGAEKLSRRIGTIRTRLALPPLTEEIGGLLLRRTLNRFEREVDPDENPWRPLAESTLRRKQAEGYGGKKKLQRTEQMKKAIKLIRGRADGGTFFNTGAGIRIGITDPEVAVRARAQNRGTTRIPMRRFLGIGALDIRAVDSFLRRKARSLETIR